MITRGTPISGNLHIPPQTKNCELNLSSVGTSGKIENSQKFQKWWLIQRSLGFYRWRVRSTYAPYILYMTCVAMDQNPTPVPFCSHHNGWIYRCSSPKSWVFKVLTLSDIPISISGWWLGHPSEKYESQLGWLFPIYGKIKNVPNHQPDILYNIVHVIFSLLESGVWSLPSGNDDSSPVVHRIHGGLRP